MNKSKLKRPLTEKEKAAIWNAIWNHQMSDDRHPREIIKEDYKGDEEYYLRTMAGWHNVPIENNLNGGREK